MTSTFFSDKAENSRRTWFWAIPILLPVFLVGGQILALLPARWANLLNAETIETYPTILYFLVASFAAGFAILALWIRYFERRGLASIGIAFAPAAKGHFSKGYVYGLAMAAISVVGVWAVGGYTIESPQDFAQVSYIPIALLCFSFIVQSSVEEFFFRGWMLSRLAERFGIWTGILGNGALFTLMHVDFEAAFDPLPFAIFAVMTMTFSIFTSLLVVRQKTIWGAAAWHAAWNWSFITWFGLPTTGIALDVKPLWVDLMMREGAPEWLTGGSDGPENSIITSVVLIACCVLAAWGAGRKKSA